MYSKSQRYTLVQQYPTQTCSAAVLNIVTESGPWGFFQLCGCGSRCSAVPVFFGFLAAVPELVAFFVVDLDKNKYVRKRLLPHSGTVYYSMLATRRCNSK
jgi:hypothetical protein